MIYYIDFYLLCTSLPFACKEAFPLKYLRGYLAAAIFGAITWILTRYGEQFSTLVDMIYPYVIRTLQTTLAQWSGQVDFCLWQLLAMVLGVIVLASIVLMILFKWNPISWFGWVLAAGCGIYMLHTLVFGLNYYAGPIAEDIQFQYSAYFMAYRYCYSALASVNSQSASAAAARVLAGVSDTLQRDLTAYNTFFQSKRSAAATKVADTANDAYLKASGDSAGLASYGQVCDLLVAWHIQEVVIPSLAVEQSPFDPYDESQVDLSGIVNAG